ncbi:prephenate dehydrogenase [Shimazuella sp. AN120528]|uniref:prephenate dehydrogenase n=1 Tax=Shimazuella soli TaxID=1892854 RepID=UPI001F0FC49B|nr:prephenate dehydrogenase [Shimazuella soli]MCH5585454.1 prephenate dehydrogenase [Shimazuella soli]
MRKRIAVLGVGLIGGSLALSFKERTNHHVIGFDTHADTVQQALNLGVIDEGVTSLSQAVINTDYIFIAVPVGHIGIYINQLANLKLKTGVIISDVGSTKAEITTYGKILTEQGYTFIGGHPMAGSHRSGVQAAHSLLFENAYYVLTPEPDTSLIDVERLSQLLKQATHAQLVVMDAEYHDKVVGAISHLPHVIATGLVAQVGNYNDENGWFHRLAAGGFRDLTRIAASHPIMWRDILLSNRKEMLMLLEDWIKQMTEFQHAIEKEDAEWIEKIFARSRDLRQRLPEKKRGLLAPIYECYINIPDEPGLIGKIATLLGEHQINLSNISIMENREEVHGILRLTFRRLDDYERAIPVLEESGYTTYTENEKEAQHVDLNK